MTESRPAIEVRGLRYSYPDGTEALRGVDLVVGRGEKVALVGPNGAGKSTLLLHLNGMLRGEGVVRVLGRDVATADRRALRELRAQVGVVFQEPDDQLFSPTLEEDVAFGPVYMGLEPGEVERRVERALSEVGLEGYGGRMPHHLSGGEKRRGALATVLSMSPEVLVVDEPSGGLDPRARRAAIRLIDEMPQTVIVATHDMRLVRDALARTVVMDGGGCGGGWRVEGDPGGRGVARGARAGGAVSAAGALSLSGAVVRGAPAGPSSAASTLRHRSGRRKLSTALSTSLRTSASV